MHATGEASELDAGKGREHTKAYLGVGHAPAGRMARGVELNEHADAALAGVLEDLGNVLLRVEVVLVERALGRQLREGG